MNPKEVFHNTAYSVQLPYIAGHSLNRKIYTPFRLTVVSNMKINLRNVTSKTSFSTHSSSLLSLELLLLDFFFFFLDFFFLDFFFLSFFFLSFFLFFSSFVFSAISGSLSRSESSLFTGDLPQT